MSPRINLGIHPVVDARGNVIHEGLSNLGMGYVFEELIRRFNEENNEEAGEHFTPRDIIQLMVHLLFEPIADQIESGTYLVYDGACGSGGMLTEAEKYFVQLAADRGKQVALELYGQEVNLFKLGRMPAQVMIDKAGVARYVHYGHSMSDIPENKELLALGDEINQG